MNACQEKERERERGRGEGRSSKKEEEGKCILTAKEEEANVINNFMPMKLTT